MSIILIVCTVLGILSSQFAMACSTRDGAPRLADQVTSAAEIFIAHLESATERLLPPELQDADSAHSIIEGRYRLIEVLKGNPKRTGIIHDLPFGIGNCSLGLLPGWYYVFLIQPPDVDFPGLSFVGFFSGSFPLNSNDSDDSSNAQLRELRTILNSSASNP